MRQPVHFSTHLCLSLVDRTISSRNIGPGVEPCLTLFRIFHHFCTLILTCKPYDANSHVSSSCDALIMHRSDPVFRREDASIRTLQTVQISPRYSPRSGLHLIANDAMSRPWPPTDKQIDAPSSNSWRSAICGWRFAVGVLVLEFCGRRFTVGVLSSRVLNLNFIL